MKHAVYSQVFACFLLAAVSCGNPGTSVYLRPLPASSNFTFNHLVTFQCAPGFLVVGPNKLKCLSNGSWSDVMPQCQPMQCSYPPIPKHAVVTSLNQTFNGTVRFTCRAGFEYSGGSQWLRCNSSGQWQPKATLNCSGEADRC